MPEAINTLPIGPLQVAAIPSLLSLNQYWLPANLEGDKSRGFVGGALSEESLLWMMDQQLVVAAMDGAEVAGYFLSYNRPDLPILQAHFELVEKLKAQAGIVRAEHRVAVGIQSALAPVWQGRGLINELRHAFLRRMAGRYEWLFTTISKENNRSLQSSQRFGWQRVGEDATHLHLVLAVPPLA